MTDSNSHMASLGLTFGHMANMVIGTCPTSSRGTASIRHQHVLDSNLWSNRLHLIDTGSKLNQLPTLCQVIANVLDPHLTPYQFLTTVTLNKCNIPEAGGLAIAKAVQVRGSGRNLITKIISELCGPNSVPQNSNQVLKSLSMSNNSLGECMS